MKGGKERRGNLHASYFCLVGNMGLPEAGLPIDGDLYGNGAPMVPNVHAVMAWAARKTLVLVVNEI